MKKTYFKKLLACLLLIGAFLAPTGKAKAQTTLAVGDLLFTGYDATLGTNNASAADRFSFILLTAISSGTTVYFTDRGFFNSSWQATGTSEGTIKWISGSALAAGTEVYIMGYTATVGGNANGTVTQVLGGNTISGLNLSTSGDQLIAFQNATGDPTASATYVAGIHWGTCSVATDANWDTIGTCAAGPTTSAIPTGLSNTTSAIWMGNPGTGGAYTQCSFANLTNPGVTQFASVSAIRTALLNKSNWNRSTSLSTGTVTVPPNNIFIAASPVITSNPPNRAICSGSNTTFTIAASNSPSSYQWQVNTGSGYTNLSDGGVYSGVTTTTLTITGATPSMSGYAFRGVATNAAGSATSTGGTLTVSNITSTGSQTNISCFGGSNGTATVTPSGGIGSYTYSWSPSGGTNATATGLAANTYTVTITDAIGCTATRQFTITQPTAITSTGIQNNVSCFGGTNGTATVTASGGAGGYTYSWSPSGGTNATASGLGVGLYTVTITDLNGCTATRQFTIIQPTAIASTGSQTNVSCFGGSNGTATVNASGGAGGYTYSWSPSGGTNATATGLAVGTYTVTITDANSCTATRQFTITQPTAIASTGSQTNVSCFGGTNGTATVNASGGAGGYTYSWSPAGGTNATASGLAVGTYTVTITDANSCTATRDFTITQPTAIASTGSQTNVSCFGGSNGTATVNASGGAGSYTYSWSPSGGTNATATGLAANTYTVTITDANGCTATRQFTITQPTAINIGTSQSNVSCFNGSNGTASANVTGGAGGYTYDWTPGNPTGDGTSSVSGLTAGTWTVTVTDANGCTASNSVTITQPAQIVANGTQTNVSCPGENDGTASVSVTGGSGVYSYAWFPSGGNNATATNLAAGSYICFIFDTNGCSASKSFNITEGITTTWDGISWSNGYPVAGNRAIVNADYTSTGDLTACALVINGTAVVTVLSGHDYTIANKIDVAPTASLTFENNSNLLQNPVSVSNTNTGNVTVKRDAKMWRQDYVYWGSPVTGQNLRNFSPATIDTRFFVMDENTNNYTAVFTPTGLNQSTLTYNFIPAKGYMVRAPNTFPNTPAQGTAPVTTFTASFNGLPNNGTFTTPIANSGPGFGFNLVSNPYPSTLSGASFLATNPGTLYFWTHHDQISGNAVNYATFNLTGQTAPAGYAGAVAPDGAIAVGQGFVYQNINSQSVATFTNAMRTGNNSPVFYREGNTKSRIWINLSQGETSLNQALIAYMPGTTTGFDASYDGALIEGGSAISSLIGTEKYAIQARNEFDATDVVPMHFTATQAGNYSISIDHTDGLFDGEQNIYIQDLDLGITHDLKGSAYNFTAEAGTTASRFQVVYQASPLANPVFETNKVVLFKENNIFNINSGNSTMAKVQIFDIRGSLIYTKDGINANTTRLNDLKAEQGVLLVKITSADGVVVTRKVVN